MSAVWLRIRMWRGLALVGLRDEPGVAYQVF